MVDHGRLDLLCILAGACFCRAPAALALEYFDFSEHSQWIDSATGTPARCLNFDLTGSLVHNHIFDGNINCDDFGDQAAGKLGAKPASLPAGDNRHGRFMERLPVCYL